MTAEQTDAIVLRSQLWSETSCIATLFTRECGKQAVLAKGAWRPRSPFEGALDLLSICRVVFIPKSGEALGVLTEAKLVSRFRMGRRDLLRLYCGYYIAELVDRFTEKADPQPELYDLAIASLNALEDLQLEPRAVVLRCEMQLLRLVGHSPTLDRCAQCGNEIASDQIVAFAPIVGGIVCRGCMSGLRPLVQLPVVARRELLKFSQPQWTTIPVDSISAEGRPAMRGIVDRYLAALLDRRMNLSSFLQELAH
jgi:DNA repair protein RecO (recombination protein O)